MGNNTATLSDEDFQELAVRNNEVIELSNKYLLAVRALSGTKRYIESKYNISFPDNANFSVSDGNILIISNNSTIDTDDSIIELD